MKGNHRTNSPVQIILATAHPAKFSEAVERALVNSNGFDFTRDVLPEEFRGLLELERRVIDVEGPDVDLVKKVIEDVVKRDAGGNGFSSV